MVDPREIAVTIKVAPFDGSAEVVAWWTAVAARLEAVGLPLEGEGAETWGARLKIGFCNLDFPPASTYFRGTLGDIVYWKHAIDLEKVQQEAKGQPGGNRECMCPARMCAKELKQHAMWQPGIVKFHCVHPTGGA